MKQPKVILTFISLFAASILSLQGYASAKTVVNNETVVATHTFPLTSMPVNKPRTTKIVSVKSPEQLMTVLQQYAYVIAIDDDGNEILLTTDNEIPPEACWKEPKEKGQKKCAAFNNKLYLTDLKTRTIMIMHGSPKITTYKGTDNELYQRCKERRKPHNHDETGVRGHSKTIPCPNPIH